MDSLNKKVEEIFYYANDNFPGGSMDSPSILRIGGVEMQVIFFPCEDNIVSFGLFFPKQEYSRKSIMLHKNGTISEDMVGIIPGSDLTENEPDFRNVENWQIVEAFYESKFEPIQSNEEEK